MKCGEWNASRILLWQLWARRFVPSASVLVLLFALLLRTIQYVLNPSLLVDETSLAVNILTKTYGELCDGLDWGQAAPIGFLMLAKTCVKLFGETELALRAWPFLASCLSVYAFYRLSKEYFRGIEEIWAVLLLVLAKAHVFYAVDFKQYSTDALATVCALLLAFRAREHRIGRGIYAVSGALLVWFSHPVIFFLLGITMTDFTAKIFKKNKTELRQILLIGLLWSGSFVVNMLISYRRVHTQFMAVFWDPFFLQKPFFSFGSVAEIWGKIAGVFGYNFGYGVPALVPVGLCCMGCVLLFLRKRIETGYLLCPIAVAVAAYLLKQYPLFERLTLFLMPALIIFMVEGISAIRVWNRGVSRLVQTGMLVLLLYVPAMALAQAPVKETMYRPALTFIQYHARQNDVVLGNADSDYYFLRMPFRNVAYRFVQLDAGPEELKAILIGTARDRDVWLIAQAGDMSDIEAAVRSSGRAMKVTPFRDYFVYRCTAKSNMK